MECLNTKPVTGKAFMLRLFTAPFMANREFHCLAEELSSEKIMFELGGVFLNGLLLTCLLAGLNLTGII